MIHGERVVVVLPAYNAERTLGQTVSEIDMDVVDEVILVDDASSDHTGSRAFFSKTGRTLRATSGAESR